MNFFFEFSLLFMFFFEFSYLEIIHLISCCFILFLSTFSISLSLLCIHMSSILFSLFSFVISNFTIHTCKECAFCIWWLLLLILAHVMSHDSKREKKRWEKRQRHSHSILDWYVKWNDFVFKFSLAFI